MDACSPWEFSNCASRPCNEYPTCRQCTQEPTCAWCNTAVEPVCFDAPTEEEKGKYCDSLLTLVKGGLEKCPPLGEEDAAAVEELGTGLSGA